MEARRSEQRIVALLLVQVLLLMLAMSAAHGMTLMNIPLTDRIVNCEYVTLGTIEKSSVMDDPHANPRMPGPKHIVSIKVRVEHSLPPLPQKTLQVSGSGYPHSLQVGNPILMFMEKKDGVLQPHYGNLVSQGVCIGTVKDGQQQIILPLTCVGCAIALSPDEAWKIVEKAEKRVRSAEPPKEEEIRNWTFDLTSGSLAAAGLAWDMLKAEPHKAKVSPAVMASALENQYSRIWAPTEPVASRIFYPNPANYFPYLSLAEPMLNELIPLANDEAVSRVLTLYIRDMSDRSRKAFDAFDRTKILKLVLACPSPARAERLRSILVREVPLANDETHVGGIILYPWDYVTREMLLETPGDDVKKIVDELDSAHPQAMKP